MKKETNDYHISFFKPTTARAKANRNKVLYLVGIWAIAIFGFQILLRVIEEPTPEPEYVAYSEVRDAVKAGIATEAEMKTYGRANLHVLSKVFIEDNDKKILRKELNGALYNLADIGQRTMLANEINAFQELRNKNDDITNPDYVIAKQNLGFMAGELLNLQANDVRITVLPLELKSELFTELKASEEVTPVMSRYLIHNRSFLTDFKFLGFPFHYFYTAVFLLILFVLLCWLYCVQTDKLDDELNIAEQ